MTKQIPLTQGQVALVDDEDFEYLNQWKWYAKRKGRNYYAQRASYVGGTQATIRMHRVILPPPEGMQVDHINGNGLDNRKANLRHVTPAQNNINRHFVKTTYPYPGVGFHKANQKWFARIHSNRKTIYLGSYGTPEEAIAARKEAEAIYHGEYRRRE